MNVVFGKQKPPTSTAIALFKPQNIKLSGFYEEKIIKGSTSVH